MLIINADDFGKSNLINHAIIKSFQRGLCSSTTLMPNMPGFEEACELAHENNLAENHVGMHLVINDGYPLTDGIKRLPKFCDKNGRFCFTRDKATFCLSSSEKEALSKEIEAQIKRCRKQGMRITHLDSHNHTHTEWGIISVLTPLIREMDIRYIRISRNCGTNISPQKRLYKAFFNGWLRHLKVARTNYHGSVRDFVYLKRKAGPVFASISFEVEIHPVLGAHGMLFEAGEKRPLDDVAKLIDNRSEAISFTGMRYLGK